MSSLDIRNSGHIDALFCEANQNSYEAQIGVLEKEKTAEDIQRLR